VISLEHLLYKPRLGDEQLMVSAWLQTSTKRTHICAVHCLNR
jgi:hypothetical protein